jgi:predicted permease
MAVLSLALGIGANTAIYSVMDAIMLRALPVKNAGELAILNWRTKTKEPGVVHDHDGANYPGPSGGVESPDFPWQVYELFRDHNNSFSTLFAYKDAGRLNLIVNGQAETGPVEFVSGNFFSGLGINPAAGRLLADSDNAAGSSQVAVIGFEYWRKRFNADPAAIGETIKLNNIPFTIAGVAAPEFYGVSAGSAPSVYIPMFNRLALAGGAEGNGMFIDHSYWVDIMGRLRPGVTLAHAEAELKGPFHQYELASATNDHERADLPALWLQEGGSGVDSLRRMFYKPLWVLMTMVALILAIACANIANLLLSRSAARRREIAVRLSLGASRMRILRQLLTESLLLSLPGGVLGLGVAAAGIRFLLWLLSGGRDEMTLRAAIDWRILAFTIFVALATGIAFGIAPAIQATRVNILPHSKRRAPVPRVAAAASSVWVGSLLFLKSPSPCCWFWVPLYLSELWRIFIRWTWALTRNTSSPSAWMPDRQAIRTRNSAHSMRAWMKSSALCRACARQPCRTCRWLRIGPTVLDCSCPDYPTADQGRHSW